MRYWEIDVARGIAVLLMISYHFIFDLFFPYHGQFHSLALLTALIFILVSGISLSISYSRAASFKKFAKRGFKLLIFGIIVTIVSFLLFDQGFILFGILQFFGTTSFLIYPFLKYSKKLITVFLSAAIILGGVIFLNTSVDFNHLIWLGLTPVTFYTFDFFPIFPWFGLLLLGAHVGNKLYPKGKRGFVIKDFGGIFSRMLQFFGRNSLMIYFIHQPIILLILSFFWGTEILSLINL